MQNHVRIKSFHMVFVWAYIGGKHFKYGIILRHMSNAGHQGPPNKIPLQHAGGKITIAASGTKTHPQM